MRDRSWYEGVDFEDTRGDARLRLRNEMSELSEEQWCAGWLNGLGHILWDAMHGGGLGVLTPTECNDLRALHVEAGGWWEWTDDDAHGPDFYPTAEWEAEHARDNEALAKGAE